MIWFTLIMFVVSFIITALLAPKPDFENARANTLDDVQFPRATEDAPIPLVLGKVRMKAPNTIWWGNWRTVAMTERVKTGLFSKTTITVGHRYFLTLDLALAMGPTMRLRKWYMDDKLIWDGNVGANAETSFNVSKSSFWGGYKNGGGWISTNWFYNGNFDQPVNSLVNSSLGGSGSNIQVPAYAGVSHLVIDAEIGESAQLRKMAFVLENYTNDLGGLPNNAIVGEDMNPAEAIYQVMTHKWRGLGISAAEIDIDALRLLGNTCYDEGNGVSIQVTAETQGKTIIQEILRQVDGVAYQDPETGRIVFQLIRDNYDVDTLDIYDEDDIKEIKSFTRSGWDEVIAQVKITYPQRDKESSAVAISQDPATAGMIGRLRSTTLSMPFCYNKTLANKLASRERAQLSVPLFRMEIEFNRNANRLRPGSVFRLNWSEYGFTNLVMRVQEFDFGALLDGRIVAKCLQDSFAVADVLFADPEDSAWVAPVIQPIDVNIKQVIEMPRFYMNRLQFPIEDGYAGVVPVAAPPSTASSGFDFLHGSATGDLDTRDPEAVNYNATGTMQSAYSKTAGFALGQDSTGFRLENISGTFVPANSEADIRPGEDGIIYANGEWMAFRGVTDHGDGTFTLSDVHRGLFGSQIKDHPLNTRVWQITPSHFGNGFLGNLSETGTLYFKFLDKIGPVTRAEEDVTEQSQVMTRVANRGHRVRNLKLDGNRENIEITNSTGSASLSWARSNRNASQVTFENDVDQTPDISDFDSEVYNIDVYHEGVLNTTLSVSEVSGPLSHSIDFSAQVLSGSGEIRVTTVWKDAVYSDLMSSAYAFLPITFNQVIVSLSYKGEGSHIIDEGVTSINIPYPSGIAEGDLLICTVMARSDLTIPTGWIQVAREDGPNNRIYTIVRRADGTETGNLTVTQAVSNRFLGQMSVLEGYEGTPFYYVDTQGTNIDDNANGVVNTGSSTIGYDDTIVYAVYTNNLAQSGSTTTTIDVEAGYTQINPLTITQNRLGIAYSDKRDIGTNDTSVDWTSDITGTSDISWTVGSIVDPIDKKVFNYPNTPIAGILARFEPEFTFENTGLTDLAEDADAIQGVKDLSENNNTITQGTISRAPTFNLAGRFASFDGSDDRLETTGLTPSNSKGSFFARFRANTGISGTQVLIGGSNTGDRAWISLTDGLASMGIGSLGSDTFKGAVDLRSATEWHTIVGVWNSTNAWLYVDGVQVNTATRGGTVSSRSPFIGARNESVGTDLFFNGDILTAGYIDEILTAAEAAYLHTYYRILQTS